MNTEKSIVNNLKTKSIQVKKLILDISHKAQVGHIGSALSIADIIAVLYFDVLRVFPKNPHNPNRDRFILSKGHAAAALYSALYLKGFFPKATLDSYCMNGGSLGVHPEYSVPGVELSTGSLGHGLSVGSGMALAGKINKESYRTFVLVSDAECNEGETWEAALFAGHHHLDNLIVIVDYNKVQALERCVNVIDLEPFADKWKSFGFTVIDVDGHNLVKLSKALKKTNLKKPMVIIAHTIRGKGVSFMEHLTQWHYLTTSQDQHKQAMEEIGVK